jgi:hypothetical protein
MLMNGENSEDEMNSYSIKGKFVMDYIMFVCLRSSILMFRPVEYNFTVFGLQMVVEDRMVVRNSEQVVQNPELVVRTVAVLLCTPLSG